MTMRISLINLSRNIPDREVQHVIRAINRQISQDFEPYWAMGGEVKLEGRSSKSRPRPDNPNELFEMRGDAVIYLWDEAAEGDPLGYHDLNFYGIPFGFVFLDIARELGEPWTVTLSHEVLELIAAPEVNLLVMGPHPDPNENGRRAFHWYEMCDAVQDEWYEIDGVQVSNFVLPLYFTDANEPGQRNDFLGILVDGQTIGSFGVNPGGYIGFFDPLQNAHDNYFATTRGEERSQIKARAAMARRALRYQAHSESPPANVAPRTAEPASADARLEAMVISTSMRCPPGEPNDQFMARLCELVAAQYPGTWSAAPFDDTSWELVPCGDSARIRVDEAWDLAHRLRTDGRIVSAEPMFEVQVDSWLEDDDFPSARSRRASGRSGGVTRPGEENREWSLEEINVPAAWELHQQRHGTTPGSDIVIGHPDTGYTENPEIWDANPARRPIKLQGARDFFDDDPNATDPLDGGNVGHGTSMASVIVSARRSGTNPDNQISGVAPGAKLIPLRTIRHVVLLSTRNLVKAINHAVDIGCHVISLSLGAPFASDKLTEAVRRARSQGVIVVAAAGNYVGFVVAPARIREVIALAATNIIQRPWRGSSRGRRVDVSAPGENVWRTRTWKDDSGSLIWEPQPSSGTSYSAAITAGVAALWLSFHGRDALVSQYGPEGLVDVFEELLKQTSHVPRDWDSDKFGAGIVDAQALLNAPLPLDPPARGRARRNLVREPLDSDSFTQVAELFEPASVSQVRSALLELFGVNEDELTFHRI